MTEIKRSNDDTARGAWENSNDKKSVSLAIFLGYSFMRVCFAVCISAPALLDVFLLTSAECTRFEISNIHKGWTWNCSLMGNASEDLRMTRATKDEQLKTIMGNAGTTKCYEWRNYPKDGVDGWIKLGLIHGFAFVITTTDASAGLHWRKFVAVNTPTVYYSCMSYCFLQTCTFPRRNIWSGLTELVCFSKWKHINQIIVADQFERQIWE